MAMKKLVFPVPASLRSWAAGRVAADGPCAAMFENDGAETPTITNFVLWANPEEYRPVTQNIGEDKVLRGFSRTVVSQSEKVVGFDFETDNGTLTAYQFLQELAKAAAASTAVYQAVTVLDYCLPEVADTATGYTIRSMKFSSPIQPRSGRYGNYTGGFSFSMLEIESRYRY